MTGFVWALIGLGLFLADTDRMVIDLVPDQAVDAGEWGIGFFVLLILALYLFFWPLLLAYKFSRRYL
jgi:hypothetical protein